MRGVGGKVRVLGGMALNRAVDHDRLGALRIGKLDCNVDARLFYGNQYRHRPLCAEMRSARCSLRSDSNDVLEYGVGPFRLALHTDQNPPGLRSQIQTRGHITHTINTQRRMPASRTGSAPVVAPHQSRNHGQSSVHFVFPGPGGWWLYLTGKQAESEYDIEVTGSAGDAGGGDLTRSRARIFSAGLAGLRMLLARATRDADLAEDLLQDAVVTALQKLRSGEFTAWSVDRRVC